MAEPPERPPADPPPQRIAAGLAWALLAVSIFAGWFVVTRLGVRRELRVWDIVALRFGVGAVVLLPVLVSARRSLTPALAREGLLLASLWGVPFVLCVALGLQLTSASEASSVTPGLMPVLAGAIAWLALGEAPPRLRLLGYAAILVGVATLLAAQSWSDGARNAAGLAALVGAATLWALYTLRVRRGLLGSAQAAAFVCVWSAVLYLPVYAALGLSRFEQAGWREVGWQALYQGVLMSGLGILAFNRAVAMLGAPMASATIGLVPVLATLAAIPVLGEWPTPLAAAGTALVAIGVALAARAGITPSRSPRP